MFDPHSRDFVAVFLSSRYCVALFGSINAACVFIVIRKLKAVDTMVLVYAHSVGVLFSGFIMVTFFQEFTIDFHSWDVLILIGVGVLG